MTSKLDIPFFAVGTEAWIVTAGREVRQVTIETVAIWINSRGAVISYTFQPASKKLLGISGRSAGETVFATEAEAMIFCDERRLPQPIFGVAVADAVRVMNEIADRKRAEGALYWQHPPEWVAEQLRTLAGGGEKVSYTKAVRILQDASSSKMGGHYNRGIGEIQQAWRAMKTPIDKMAAEPHTSTSL